MQALADYGYYAQPYLAAQNGWTIGENYAAMTTHVTESYDYGKVKEAAAEYAIVKDTGDSVTGISYRMRFGSEIELQVILTPAEGVTIDSVTVNDEAVTPKKSGEKYIVSIPGIKATQLTASHTVAAADASVTISPMSYVYGILASSDTTDAAKNLVCALYNYAQACKL